MINVQMIQPNPERLSSHLNIRSAISLLEVSVGAEGFEGVRKPSGREACSRQNFQ